MMCSPARMRRLSCDMDIRMLPVWQLLWQREDISSMNEQTHAAMATAMRMAYNQGYRDSLVDDREGNRGRLYTDHGYRTPEGT